RAAGRRSILEARAGEVTSLGAGSSLRGSLARQCSKHSGLKAASIGIPVYSRSTWKRRNGMGSCYQTVRSSRRINTSAPAVRGWANFFRRPSEAASAPPGRRYFSLERLRETIVTLNATLRIGLIIVYVSYMG